MTFQDEVACLDHVTTLRSRVSHLIMLTFDNTIQHHRFKHIAIHNNHTYPAGARLQRTMGVLSWFNPFAYGKVSPTRPSVSRFLPPC